MLTKGPTMKFSAMRNAVRTAFVLAACATLVAACSDSQQNAAVRAAHHRRWNR